MPWTIRAFTRAAETSSAAATSSSAFTLASSAFTLASSAARAVVSSAAKCMAKESSVPSGHHEQSMHATRPQGKHMLALAPFSRPLEHLPQVAPTEPMATRSACTTES
jgi:hypothetical protein